MSSKHHRRRGLIASSLAAASAAALFGVATPALAQTSNSNDIVVTAATREQTQSFVSQISAAPVAADQLGRWNDFVCIGVAGLPARQGQFIADRVAQRAYAVGLSPAEPGCAPNISIVVAPNGSEAAQRMFAQDESLFAYRYESGVSTLGREAFDTFLNSDAPVRWWHVTRTLSADGEAIGSGGTTPGATGAFDGVQTVRSNGSRMRSTTRQDFSRVVIIVDGSRASSVQLSGLADYVSMVALAQIDPQADTAAYPTIMNLFSDSASSGMTSWDVAFLEGLYQTNRDAPSTTVQRADIARRMLNERPS